MGPKSPNYEFLSILSFGTMNPSICFPPLVLMRVVELIKGQFVNFFKFHSLIWMGIKYMSGARVKISSNYQEKTKIHLSNIQFPLYL